MIVAIATAKAPVGSSAQTGGLGEDQGTRIKGTASGIPFGLKLPLTTSRLRFPRSRPVTRICPCDHTCSPAVPAPPLMR